MLKISFRRENWARLFFILWSGQALSLLGSQLVQFALIWWLTRTTGSATVLALASLVGLLPRVILGPLTGALVDRWNRRLVMILADTFIALATVVLAVLFATRQVEIWHVYSLMFIRSAAGGFHWSAMNASTSLMVPDRHLARIQGLNQSLDGGLNILSAPLGALLIELLSIQGVLLVDVLTAAVAVLPLLVILIPEPAQANHSDRPGLSGVWQDVLGGARYALNWPGLLWVSGMAMLINLLLNPAFTLQPLLVTQHFSGGAFEFAWMESAGGGGIILGGLLLGTWGGFRRRIHTTLFGLFGIGLGSLVIGFVPGSGYVPALGAVLLVGLSVPLTNGPLFAILQSVVEPEMQGRIFALIGSLSSAMSPLGLLVAGPVADRFGVQSWFVLAGGMTLLLGAAGFFIPAVVNIEAHHRDRGAAAVERELGLQPVEVQPRGSLGPD